MIKRSPPVERRMNMLTIRQLQHTINERILYQVKQLHIEKGAIIGLIGDNGSGKSTLLQQIHHHQGNPSSEWTGNPSTFLLQQMQTEGSLSGGEQVLKQLQHAFLQPVDLLLLDEPTNHLDEQHVDEWIAQMKHAQQTLIIATHDRYLLQQVATVIWSIEHGKLQVYPGNYEHYLEQLAIRERTEQQQFSKQQALVKQTEQQLKALSDWSQAMHQSSTANHHEKAMGAKEYYRKKAKRADRQVRSKRQRLEQTLEKEGVDRPLKKRQVSFSITDPMPSGQRQIGLQQATIGYDKPLLTELTFHMHKGDRIAVTGRNGSGKTALLQSVQGQLPLLAGERWQSPQLKIGVLQQHIQFADEQLTIEAFLDADTLDEVKHLQQQLYHFGFAPSSWSSPLHTLSGGERVKLQLLQFIHEGCQLLILDEPTNHLDMKSITALEQALQSYNGSLLVVSHDRYFREALTTTSISCDPLPSKDTKLTNDKLMLQLKKDQLLAELSIAEPGTSEYFALEQQFNEVITQLKKE